MNDEIMKKLTEAQIRILQAIRLRELREEDSRIISDHHNDLTIRLNMVYRELSQIIIDGARMEPEQTVFSVKDWSKNA